MMGLQIGLGLGRSGPPADELSTTADILAAAVAATPGATINIAQSWMNAQGRYLMNQITGSSSVKVIGGTDFVAVSPNLPNDVDLQVNVQVDHTTSTGTVIPSRGHTSQVTHPLWGEQEAMFGGQDFTFASNAPPFDYSGATPLGLKIRDTVTVATKARAYLNNPIRHNAVPHDGHVIWIAECTDGTTDFTYVHEGYLEAGDSAWPSDIAMEANLVTHLKRLVTLQVEPFSVDDTSEMPCRWETPVKRLSSAYTADATVTDLATLETALAALTDADFAGPNTNYVISLAAGEYQSSFFDFRLGTAASNALSALTGGRRVFLTGSLGQTIVAPILGTNPMRNLDFGWCIIRRTSLATATRPDPANLILVPAGSDVGFYGCYMDGVDGLFRVAVANNVGVASSDSLVVSDCIIVGVQNGLFVGSSTVGITDSRCRVARNFIEATNDIMRSEAGSIRVEKNFQTGGGGWMQVNFMYQHTDVIQTQPAATPNNIKVAYLNNVFDHGPGRGGVANLRISGTQSTIFNRIDEGMYWVNGNIIQSTTSMVRGLEWGADSYTIAGEMTQNVLWHYPDLTARSYHTGYNPRDTLVSGDNILRDAANGHNNIVSLDNRANLPNLFTQPYEPFPDADIGERAAFAQPAEMFASPPAAAGTFDTGYTISYAGTTNAGTSREGFISPLDFAANLTYQTFKTGPGLLSAAEITSRGHMDFPADVFVHCGWEGAKTGLPVDLLEQYSPVETTITGTHTNPWGTADNINGEFWVNLKLGATVGAGKVIHEVNGTDEWSLEILAGGQVQIEVIKAGAVTHRVTSRDTVSANSHILAHVDLTFRDWSIDSIKFAPIVRWKSQAGDAFDNVFVTQQGLTTPTSPTPAAGEVWVWYNQNDKNHPWVWNGSAWVMMHGDDAVFLCYMAKPLGGITGSTQTYLANITFPAGITRIYMNEDVTTIAATPNVGDFAVYNSGAMEVRKWDGAAWQGGVAAIGAYASSGWLRADLRIDGAASLFAEDWIWGDGTNNGTLPAVGGVITYSGYNALVRYIDARRGDLTRTAWAGTAWAYRTADSTGLYWAMRRTPDDEATGARGYALPAPAVWIKDGVAVPPLDSAAQAYSFVGLRTQGPSVGLTRTFPAITMNAENHVIFLSMRSTNPVNSLTVDGVAATQVFSVTGGTDYQLIAYEITPAAAGSKVIEIALAADVYGSYRIAVCQVANASRVSSLDASQGGENPTVIEMDTNTTAGDIVIGAVTHSADDIMTVGAGFDQIDVSDWTHNVNLTVASAASAAGGAPEAFSINGDVAFRTDGAMVLVYR